MSFNAISAGWSAAITDVIDVCANAGIGGLAVWRHHLELTSAKEVRTRCEDAGLRITSLCRAGAFPAEQASERAARVDEAKRAVEEAAELGADALVIVSGPVVGRDIVGSRAMVADALAEVVPWAAAAGVRLGLEPLHPMFAADRSVVVTLSEGSRIVSAFASDALGLIVDVYHCWWDADVHNDIAAAAGTIAGFHVSDWVPPSGDVLLCRAAPGDGCVDLPGLRGSVERAGYDGPIEVEVMNGQRWQMPLAENVSGLRRAFLAHV